MTTRDATGQLALLLTIGELVVAIEANQVFQIRRAPEVGTRRIEANLYALDLDDQTIPGWDAGELFGVGACKDAWVILEAELGHRVHMFGLRVGRCIAVRPLPPCLPLPRGVFAARAGAICAAFSTTSLAEVQHVPSGGLLALRQLLTQAELDAGARLLQRREGHRDATP
jgi:hypothetical protein